MNRRKPPRFALALALTAWGSAQAIAQTSDPTPEADPAYQLVLTSDVEWGPLNPARGDKGPRAAALWGDRTGAGPSGFLVEFAEGFSSPPHIHNVTYRGVVIRGLLHNDDPDAEQMWMPAGSYWTQPAGEAHITAARDSRNLAYIEIEDGPYLVLPTEEAFDNGERPVNVDPSNLVWLDASNITWLGPTGRRGSTEGLKIAFLWGRPQADRPSGTLVELPAGFTAELHSHGSFRAVVIQGRSGFRIPGETEIVTAGPGSYFGSKTDTAQEITCQASEACLLYLRTTGEFDLMPRQESKP